MADAIADARRLLEDRLRKIGAEEIYERLADGSMPCDGPWADEQVQRVRDRIDACAPA